MQDRAVCFMCHYQIDHDPVFCAPCDHAECPSGVFHGLCLMEWREHRAQVLAQWKAHVEWEDD